MHINQTQRAAMSAKRGYGATGPTLDAPLAGRHGASLR